MPRSTVPAHLLPNLVAVEQELDQIWPGREVITDHATGNDSLRVKPFNAIPDIAKLRRIKYLLKRWSLLASGRDWEVRIVGDPRDRTGRKCYAHSILPTDTRPEDGVPPPLVIPASAPVPAAESPTVLALRLRVPLETVEAAALASPDDVEAEVVRRMAPRPKRAHKAAVAMEQARAGLVVVTGESP